MKKAITLCSSVSFYKQVLEIEKKLEQMRFTVYVPKTAKIMEKSGNFNPMQHKTWFETGDFSKKTELMNAHFREIDKADAILVVNYEKNGITGYIGGNVLLEMFYAYLHKKPIYLFNPLSSNSPLYEEVMGLEPKIINGELQLIT